MSTAMTACVNPLFFDNVQPAVNHTPVLVGMQPQPSFARRPINVGENCRPESFVAARLDDADLDTLTVRWSLLLPRAGSPEGAQEILFEEELPANLEATAVDPAAAEPALEAVYDFKPFEILRSTILNKLGQTGLDEQTNEVTPVEGQLLELRISDRGFKAGESNLPNADDGLVFYLSWAVKLLDEEC